MAKYKSDQLTSAAGVPGLYRDGNGKYHARIMRHGKAHKKSLKTADLATARRKLRDYEKTLEKQIVELPDITFEEASKKWLESQYDLKAKSKGRRVTSLNAITPTFKGRKLRTITKQEISEWATKRSKEVSPRSFNLDRETLSMMFDYAKDTLTILEKNHASSLAKMKVKKTAVVPPTREQFSELVAFLDKSKRLNKEDRSRNAALFVRFLAYTGMRIEEARHVLWKHIDFEKGTLLVTGNDTGTKNLSERTIPLFQPVRELLEDFPKDQRHANSPIFAIITAKEVLKTASTAIGIAEGEHFGHHDMRHFFCSNAIELLIPDHVIAAWLGHKDGGMLVKTTYGHLRKNYGDAEALKMTFKG